MPSTARAIGGARMTATADHVCAHTSKMADRSAYPTMKRRPSKRADAGSGRCTGVSAPSGNFTHAPRCALVAHESFTRAASADATTGASARADAAPTIANTNTTAGKHVTFPITRRPTVGGIGCNPERVSRSAGHSVVHYSLTVVTLSQAPLFVRSNAGVQGRGPSGVEKGDSHADNNSWDGREWTGPGSTGVAGSDVVRTAGRPGGRRQDRHIPGRGDRGGGAAGDSSGQHPAFPDPAAAVLHLCAHVDSQRAGAGDAQGVHGAPGEV